MTRLYSYIVAVDSGFAPNPFHGYCTVATCKPQIRKTSEIGDWIVGTGSATNGRARRIVYAMRVSGAMTFEEYWENPLFYRKRPVSAGREKTCGDNIYHRKAPRGRRWQQEPSYHSCPDGRPDIEKLRHDTSVNRVLISDDFVYWGGDGPLLPLFRGIDICHTTQGHRIFSDDEVVQGFIDWVRSHPRKGRIGEPTEWSAA